jgi:hypothetical protein
MIDCLEKIDAGNLLLIRAYQFYDQKMNDSGQAIEEATTESSENCYYRAAFERIPLNC